MTVIGKDEEGCDIVQCDSCGKKHQANNGQYIGCFRPWGIRHYCNECAEPYALKVYNNEIAKELDRAIVHGIR